jgi:FAD/FMN-containing dehydrogenase
MPVPRRRSRFKRFLTALGFAALVGAYPLWRAARLAADPSGPKECPPLTPEPAGRTQTDTREQPTIEVSNRASLPWAQRGGSINDASCLNRTFVLGLVQVATADDVRNALQFARQSRVKVSIAGVRHSMGGHAFARNAIVLDMTRFNRMSLDAEQRVLTVQAGATWHDIQTYLHPRFAVKAMQSTDIFTVGGSISVNAHGMDHLAGSVGHTIRAMRVMLPDGSVREVTRSSDPRLFRLIVGGYGLFGVILDADLDVTPNVVYRSDRRVLDYVRFPSVFASEIASDPSIGLMYAHLSTSPGSLLRELFLYSYRRIAETGVTIPPLGEISQIKLRRLVFNLAKHGSMLGRLKSAVEKHLEPRLESCPISRNQAMSEGESCLVSRNNPMHDSVPYLRNDLPEETDILHEYFIPRDQFVPFVDALRQIVVDERAHLLNASVRVVRRDDTFLSYAPDDAFAIVLYLNQSTDAEGNARMARLTRLLIDLCAQVKGRFFLPYQLHYTPEQLERSYPEIREFFRAKQENDPDGLLTSTFYERYSRALGIVGP